MNQLSSIKERLKNFNETEFQELCDCFLSIRFRGYKAFSRTGAHDTKQKTTRGTPDSFILMSNGFYIFIESTTTEHKGKRLLNKLKSDISGCLNVKTTKIPVNKIQEIILCYNSNLKVAEIKEVNKKAEELMGKPPKHFNLDSLATEIFFHHKNLAHDYLGLPLDTGQIVSLDKFVQDYDNGKQKLATPLKGVFLHRTKELEVVKNQLTIGDIVIISGPAGVGKSKLALKSIKQFIESHLDYNAYAISPKGADLLGDLGAYFEGEGNNILLVDDVNRIDKFEQILGFYRGLKHGKLKLVLTVRDYALENVRERLSLYEKAIVEIGGFGYQEINTIIEQDPFEVRNVTYQNKIYSIAKGNARLAVMMAMIARKTNKLESLNNVADLFEQYFETFVSDENAFKDKLILKALGILSFFYTLPYNDNELLNSVAHSFSIPTDGLREAFDKLHSLDLIEMNYQHVRIGEQNLSTYFFYKVFIKERLLSFKSLWYNYFELQEHRFKDTVFPMHQSFGKDLIKKEIKPTLLSYWSDRQLDESKAFRFLNFSWEFLPNECLSFLESKIESLVPSDVAELNTKYKTNDFANTLIQEKHLHLLANFLKEPTYFIDALELSFQFVKKNPHHLPELIYHIDRNFNFIDEDYINHFERHANLINYLVDEVEKGELQALSFVAVSKNFLQRFRWNYKDEKEAKNDDSNIASVKKSRGKVLDALCNIYDSYPKEVFEVMLSSSSTHEKDNKYTLAFDLVYLIPWIGYNMNSNDFHHCFYVQELIRTSIKGNCNHNEFKRLKSIFTHPTYSLFELINWDRVRSKDLDDLQDYQEFKKLKIANIHKKLIFNSKDEVKQFSSRYFEILKWNEIRLHSQFIVIDTIIEANLKIDSEIGFTTFIELAKLHDTGRFKSDFFISYNSIENLSAYPELSERLWKAIYQEGLDESWQLDVLTSLPVKSITNKHLSRLYNFLNKANKNFQIQLQHMRKYEKLDPEILTKVLQIAVRRIEKDSLKIWIQEDFFVQVSDFVEDLKTLKKAYFQQNELHHHFDYRRVGLQTIVKRDKGFMLEYIKEIFVKSKLERAKDYQELTFVWDLLNVNETMDEAIEYMASDENHYYFSEHFANAFFQRLTENGKRADKYLLRFIDKYSDQPKMINIAINVIHNSRRHLFNEVFGVYIQKNQDLESFSQIQWTKNQILFSGTTNVSETRANQWNKILILVENEKLEIKVRKIKKYITKKIDSYLNRAENERRNNFIL